MLGPPSTPLAAGVESVVIAALFVGLGYLLADAKDGFPIPYYPLCLQKADEYAQVVGLDLDILQSEVMASIEEMIGDQRRNALDAFRLTPDFTGRRYR